ncbi:hypothetical protein CPAR01_00423 [Colletotrichum paranaense]|uniref:Uncharacterized protein n=1 Tax=Colletotrichum paranaense TaxID=1914294 RepID=A0ABQ9T5P3_9PEZI|nr:uncharacterized protein CPAR01_00423 [Colletotrichum paranaense]KAK1546456.1 hypothetical protein CPAR01_00423 [Colletotrichum paranaense]
MPSLAGKLLRAPVTGRTPCSANVACATPPEGPSLDDQSVINGKIMLGALSSKLTKSALVGTPKRCLIPDWKEVVQLAEF